MASNQRYRGPNGGYAAYSQQQNATTVTPMSSVRNENRLPDGVVADTRMYSNV